MFNKIEKKITDCEKETIYFIENNNNNLQLVDLIELLDIAKNSFFEKLLIVLNKSKNDLIESTIIEYFFYYVHPRVYLAIKNKLKSKNSLTRMYSIEYFAKIKAYEIEKDIIKMIDTANDEELVRIYYALYNFGKKEYLDKLLDMLKPHYYYRARIAVANFLYEILNTNNLDKKDQIKILNILKKYKNDSIRSVKYTIIEILEEIEDS